MKFSSMLMAVFLGLFFGDAAFAVTIIEWPDSNIKYHLSDDHDRLLLGGVGDQLIPIGIRNDIRIFPFQTAENKRFPNFGLPKSSPAFLAVFASQIRYFDKYGLTLIIKDQVAGDGGAGLIKPEFIYDTQKRFSLIRFTNTNGFKQTLLIYQGKIVSLPQSLNETALTDLSVNDTALLVSDEVKSNLSDLSLYTTVEQNFYGKSATPGSMSQKLARAAINQVVGANDQDSGGVATSDHPKDSKGEELSEKEKESVEIAAKLGIKHPKDLGIKVSNGEGGTSDAWELVKPFISDLRVKYKDRTYDPADMDQESIDILDRIVETFHASEVASVAHVGPAGSGKSETISTFVGRLNAGKDVGELNKYMILELNLAGLLAAGGKYTGGTESVMNALQSILEAIPVVLVVDEVHNMKGSGSTEGKPSDIRQYIKPGMARGLVKLWGITTKPEFYNAFEDDPAWIQRHRIIEHPEPQGEALMKKLRGWVKFKFKGKIVLDDSILEKAIEFSNRFDAIGAQPRRGVKFIDYLIAMKRKENNGELVNPTYDDLMRFVQRDYEVDPSMFDPTHMMPQLEKLSDQLSTGVVGQLWAKDAIIRSESIALAGFQELNRPQGRLLLVGPHGNGHSKLVQIYSEVTQRPLVTIDMKNYSRPSDLEDFTKKIGQALQDNARSLFFFKNPESASADVQKTLGLILQNGDVLVRQKNNINTASMRNAIAIVSSFTHIEELNKLQDPSAEFDPSTLRDHLGINNDLADQLEIVPITPLSKSEFRLVIEKQVKDTLEAFSSFAKGLTITIKNKDALMDWMTEKFSADVASGTQSKSYLKGFGSIQSEVAIARALNPKGTEMELNFNNGRLEVDGGAGACKLTLRRATPPPVENP